MATAKLLSLFVTVVAQIYATTAPNVRPPNEELREQRGAERVVSYFTASTRGLIWSWGFLEGSVLFALNDYCPPALARLLLRALLPSLIADSTTTLTPLTTLTKLTPTFLAGAILSLGGSLLRAHCFRALGSCFTFELSIRPSHKLVTDGVYGIVRHPSYTGGIMVAMGWLLCVLDRRGSVVSVCVAWAQALSPSGAIGDKTVTSVLTCLRVSALAMAYVASSKRMSKEDEMLEKNFGEEWRMWARRVPYRLVPGVY